MKPPIRVGIAGYGIVGRRRRQMVDANPRMCTVAISDILFAERPMVDPSVHVETSWERLLDHELDALIVSLPNDIAPAATIAGIERGLHVFCEKPPGRSMADIRRVREVEARHPEVRLKYGFNHRYHDSVVESKRIIESGRFGKVINVRGLYGKSSVITFAGAWRSDRALAGGGILLDQGIHMLDMIRYFCGDFDEVQSFVSNSYWKHNVEDNAYAIMRSRQGVVAMLHSTATQWRHTFRLEITLEEGLLELTGILSGSKSYGEERLTIVPRREGSVVGAHEETTTQYLDDHSWEHEIREFAEILDTGAPIVHGTSYDAERVMELVFRIYHADERWRESYNIPDPLTP